MGKRSEQPNLHQKKKQQKPSERMAKRSAQPDGTPQQKRKKAKRSHLKESDYCWYELQTDLPGMIIFKRLPFADSFLVGAVCRLWHEAAQSCLLWQTLSHVLRPAILPRRFWLSLVSWRTSFTTLMSKASAQAAMKALAYGWIGSVNEDQVILIFNPYTCDII